MKPRFQAPVFQRPPAQVIPNPFMMPQHDMTIMKRMAAHIESLEREVMRFTEEIKIRSEIAKRERKVRNALKEECEDLREEVGRLRSVLHAREREIYDLERQLRAREAELTLMKRRHAAASAAVSRKGSPSPGSISSLPKELRTIGTQINEISDMEDRIERLMLALNVEKERNRRIKSMLITCEDNSATSAVPPMPVASARSRSQPPARRPFTTNALAGRVVINGMERPRLTQQIFMGLNASAPAPKEVFLPQPEYSPPPILLSPIKKVPHTFRIFEDKENDELHRLGLVNERPVLQTLERANVAPDLVVSPFKKSSAPTAASSSSSMAQPERREPSPLVRLQPPPFVPQLNLASLPSVGQQSPPQPLNTSTVSTSSEAAIKRAVAAAIEKRKQLAHQGVSMGSARSSILGASSFMSNSPINISGVKARFCLPLG